MRELLRRAGEQRQPANAVFELTERCNLRCRMCYVRHAAGDAACRAEELTAGAWLEVARQAKAGGALFMLLTGGEIFLRPDFFEIFTPLTRMGFILALYTNGTLITDEIARRLAEAPPSRIEITLYGATAETYEHVTGVKGSYERCIRGIESLVNHGVTLGLRSTITRQNAGELSAMRAMAQDWGARFRASWLLTKRRDGAHSEVTSCRLSAGECIELEASERATASDWIENAQREAENRDGNNFYCHAGKSSYVVNSRGEMNACIDLLQPAARPLEIGFPAAWEQTQAYVDSAPPLHKDCLACTARGFCYRCPAWSELETGSLNEPVPYLCEIAFAREAHYRSG